MTVNQNPHQNNERITNDNKATQISKIRFLFLIFLNNKVIKIRTAIQYAIKSDTD